MKLLHIHRLLTFAGQQLPNPAAAQGQAQAQAPARPQMPVPPQPQAPTNSEDFWKDFGGAADRDPQNAWRYLNAAQQNPQVFRDKLTRNGVIKKGVIFKISPHFIF